MDPKAPKKSRQGKKSKARTQEKFARKFPYRFSWLTETSSEPLRPWVLTKMSSLLREQLPLQKTLLPTRSIPVRGVLGTRPPASVLRRGRRQAPRGPAPGGEAGCARTPSAQAGRARAVSARTLGRGLAQPQVGGDGVVEEQEVHLVEAEEAPLVEGADVAEEALGPVAGGGPGPRRWLREAQAGRAREAQHEGRVLSQRLELAHHVVAQAARVAERVGALPVLVEGSFAARARVQEVGQELGEAHVVAAGQRVWAWVRPQAPHDVGAEAALEGGAPGPLQLVAVGRGQALEGLAHEEEGQVGAQTPVDLGRAEVGQRGQAAGRVRVGRGDGARVAGAAAVQRQQHALPVGAGHLGHVAVEQAARVVHQHVPQVLGPQQALPPGVAAAGAVQQLSPLPMHLGQGGARALRGQGHRGSPAEGRGGCD
uniref:Chromosome 22 C3orf22 homolog n=2 Tax=Bos TaxID=9903 RepID=A0AAA9SUR8_BOVIN